LESSAYSLNISTPPSPLEDDEDCFDQEKTVSLNTLTSISSIGPISTSSAKSRVLLLSAKDKEVAVVMLSRLKDYVKHSTLADEELIDRLAHTLDHHRSRFSWRVSFLSSTTKAGLVAKLEDSTLLTPIRSTRIPRLGFVFTGQGAQWYAMGRELIEVYPVFSATLQEADKHLQDMNSSWSLVGRCLVQWLY
jgi:acyl transferase domain-containing protein